MHEFILIKGIFSNRIVQENQHNLQFTVDFSAFASKAIIKWFYFIAFKVLISNFWLNKEFCSIFKNFDMFNETEGCDADGGDSDKDLDAGRKVCLLCSQTLETTLLERLKLW